MLSQQRSWQLGTILVLMLALSVGVSGRVVGQARTEVGTAPQSNPGNATPTSPPLPTSPAAVPPALSADRDATAARPRAAVSEGDGNLPNTQGQIWREYDITPYTAQVTTTERPEQAILDWILRDTGTEVWFCLLYTSPSPRDLSTSRMPSSA